MRRNLVDIAFDDENENPLTERESQVLRLVSEGKTTKEIAGELYLTPGTVRNYISTILDKLESAIELRRFLGLRRKAGLSENCFRK